jgi:hypothetical protein
VIASRHGGAAPPTDGAARAEERRMSELPDLHPDTGEPTKIVVGYINPMLARDMRIGGRGAAYGEGRALIDMRLAKEIAERYVGTAAEAHLGRVLIKLLDDGAVPPEQFQKLAQAHREFMHLAEGVDGGKPSAIAVKVANRIVSPGGMIELSGDAAGGDLVVLAYATLQLDQERVLDGGVS